MRTPPLPKDSLTGELSAQPNGGVIPIPRENAKRQNGLRPALQIIKFYIKDCTIVAVLPGLCYNACKRTITGAMPE